jgi:hypothetical protein
MQSNMPPISPKPGSISMSKSAMMSNAKSMENYQMPLGGIPANKTTGAGTGGMPKIVRKGP